MDSSTEHGEETTLDIEAARQVAIEQRLSRLESVAEKLTSNLKAPTPPVLKPGSTLKRELLGGLITHHHVWWLFVLPANFAWLGFVLGGDITQGDRSDTATALALVNLLAVVAVRDGTFLLLLYTVVIRIPWRKYFFNRTLHCNGGLHTGCSLMLLMWTSISLAMTRHEHPVDLALLSVLCSGLIVMMLLAISPVREKQHNLFERVHRYLGWSLMALLTATLCKKFTDINWRLSKLPAANACPMLVCLFLVFYSWLMIEYRDVEVKTGDQGSVVVVRLQGKARAGAFAKISFNLVEWHAFSVAFRNREKRYYGLIVGVAGDWTRLLAQKSRVEIILSRAARSLTLSSMSRRTYGDQDVEVNVTGETPVNKLESMDQMKTVKAFVRWHRPLGFMYSVYAYERVVCVGTGAGIAPILPHIGNGRTEVYVVWIAKKHREMYGEEICERVFQHPHHTVYDTAVEGRPSPEVALAKYDEFRAQAVFVVSNAPFTEAVRKVCKERNVPGYGAVFDS